MSKKLFFRLVDMRNRETVCLVQVDQDKFTPENEIIDFDSMTCRHVANGAYYTLMPVEHHTTLNLRRIADVYKNITESPARSFSTMIGRADTLIEQIGLLLEGTAKYYVVNNRADIAALIAPTVKHQPVEVETNVFDDLVAAIHEKYGTIETMVADANEALTAANVTNVTAVVPAGQGASDESEEEGE